MNSLADLILEATSDKSAEFSTLGEKLFQKAREIKKDEESKVDDEIEELRKKFSRFRSYEKNHDILMIPYLSFYSLDAYVQSRIKDLDHIVWGSVFVSYDIFKNKVKEIFTDTTDVTIFIEKRGAHYELISLKDNPNYKTNAKERDLILVHKVSVSRGIVTEELMSETKSEDSI